MHVIFCVLKLNTTTILTVHIRMYIIPHQLLCWITFSIDMEPNCGNLGAVLWFDVWRWFGVGGWVNVVWEGKNGLD